MPCAATGQLPPPCQMRLMSISDPAYSPGLSTPSSAGAAGACAIVVRGRIDIETVSAPGPRVELVVVTTTFADWSAGSAVSVFVIENVTMASAPGASGPYGFEVSAAVKFAGSVRLTVPLCASSDQLWTLTGNSIGLTDDDRAEPGGAADATRRRSRVLEPVVVLEPLAEALEAPLDGRHEPHGVVRVAGHRAGRVARRDLVHLIDGGVTRRRDGERHVTTCRP